jgi:pimeloyl-ACP methyl ester carboxylesterase
MTMNEFMVPAKDPGIELYLRNKHPRGTEKFESTKILLMVHGATYPASTSYDLALNGVSWMDHVARQGYDVYCLDLRGFGRSTRPPEMSQPAADNPPVVRTETAARDVAAAVDFILARRGVAKLNLLGWSWGTAVTGLYATRHNDKLEKLVLYAPAWVRSVTAPVDPGSKLGAYRIVERASAKKRWLNGVAEAQQASLLPEAWYQAWEDATFATDPEGAKLSPPGLRAPNGSVQDLREYWLSGRPVYEPSEIRVPVLLTHAEWDVDLPSALMHAYFAQLVNAPYRRSVEIGEGTHMVMLEKNRMQLFQAVQQFLDERYTPES